MENEIGTMAVTPEFDDTISDVSPAQGTISTSGTEPLTKEFRQAHELRLNLIYSGTFTVGMLFLCMQEFVYFLLYPTIIFLLLHALLELRHDIVHKSRYYAHARYTQASPYDRSYGGDLYLANLAQSWLVFLGFSFFLIALILRKHDYSIKAYRAIYFIASLFIFLSGATTMLNRGCGSFYFLGRSPGFSVKDQTGNFLYVASSVLLLVVASWQFDRGVFDLPLQLNEYLIFLLWLAAALHYTAADVTRLTEDNKGNANSVADAMIMSVDGDKNDDEYDTNYVEMGQTGNNPLNTGDMARNERSASEAGLDRTETLRTPVPQSVRMGSGSTFQSSFGNERSIGTRQSSMTRTVSSPVQGNRDPSQRNITGLERTGSLPSVSTAYDASTQTTMMDSEVTGMARSVTADNRPLASASPPPSVSSSTQRYKRGSSWKERLGFNTDLNCGDDVTPSCTPIIMNPSAGPVRSIPGRDVDSASPSSHPPSSAQLHSMTDWGWQSMQQAGQQMSSFMGGLMPQMNSDNSNLDLTGNAREERGTQNTSNQQTPLAETRSMETGHTSSAENQAGPHGLSSPPPVQKKRSKKLMTKYWGDREIV